MTLSSDNVIEERCDIFQTEVNIPRDIHQSQWALYVYRVRCMRISQCTVLWLIVLSGGSVVE